MTYEEFIKRIESQGSTMEKELNYKLQRVAHRLKARARLEVSTTGWPFLRTGKLFRSLASDSRIVGKSIEISLRAGGGDVDYAGYVEYGTSRIEPRLYLDRTIKKEQSKMVGGDYKFLRELIGSVLGAKNA